MLTFLNQKELCITRHLEEQANIRDILQNNHIDYKMKIVDHNNYASTLLTSVSANNRDILYKFYVHKKNYEYACHLIQTIQR